METKITTKGIDVLIYLGIIITLGTSVYNLISVIFSAIDFKFGDVVQSYDVYNDSVRMAISMLAVMFPTYLGLSFYAAKVAREDFERANAWPRRMTIFANLFITAATLIGSLVSTVYTYLGGDLSLVFGLKVLTVVIVALMVGGYYLYNLKRDITIKNNIPYIFAGIGSVVVVFSIAWSIVVFGTPSELRDRKFDNQRLLDISNIQNQILNYWQTNKAIPDTLAQLNDPFSGFSVPVDPQTKASYEYKIIKQSDLAYELGKTVPTNAKFELCATFITERNVKTDVTGAVDAKIFVQPVGFYYNQYDQTPFWNHGVGRACFDREIKKEMFAGVSPVGVIPVR